MGKSGGKSAPQLKAKSRARSEISVSEVSDLVFAQGSTTPEDPSSLSDSAAPFNNKPAFNAMQLVSELAAAPTLEGQIIVIKNNKAALRAALQAGQPGSEVSVKTVLFLYLHPASEVLRRYLDWAIDLILRDSKDSKDKECGKRHAIVRECCTTVWRQLEEGVDVETVSASRLMEVSSSVVCLGSLHKDVEWLLLDTTNKSSSNNHEKGSSPSCCTDLAALDPALLHFCRLVRILFYCSSYLSCFAMSLSLYYPSVVAYLHYLIQHDI
jgi:hypothetical protein